MKRKIKSLLSKIIFLLKNNIFILVATFFILGLSTSAAIISSSKPRYSISSLSDLKKIENNLDAKYVFSMSNLIIADDWTPLGDPNNPFTGVLDGNGATITFRCKNQKFTFTKYNDEYIFGLFGCNKGTIKNLNFYFEDFEINDPSDDEVNRSIFGTLAAYNYGTIYNCSFVRASGGPIIKTTCDLVSGSIFGVGGGDIKSVYSTTILKTFCKSLIYGSCCGICNTDATIERFFSSTVLEGQAYVSSNLSGVVGLQQNKSKLDVYNTLNQSNFNSFKCIQPSISAGYLCDAQQNCSTTIKTSLNRSNFSNDNFFSSGFIYNGNSVVLENLLSSTSASSSVCFNFISSFDSFNSRNLYFKTEYLDKYGNQKDYVSIDELNWDSNIWKLDNGDYKLLWNS